MKKILQLILLAALSATAVKAIPVNILIEYEQIGPILTMEMALFDDTTLERLSGDVWVNGTQVGFAHGWGFEPVDVRGLVANYPIVQYGLNEGWFVMADGFRSNSVFFSINPVPEAGVTALLLGSAIAALVAARRRSRV